MKIGIGSFFRKRRARVLPLRESVVPVPCHLIPAPIRHVYGRTRRVSPSDPLPYVGFLKALAAVPGSTVFFDLRRNLLSDEIFENSHFLPDLPLRHRRFLDQAQTQLTKSLKNQFELPRAIHLFGEYATNYFHWLVEVLPRALAIRSSLFQDIAGYGPVVVDPDLPVQHYEALDLILGSEIQILRPDPGRLVFAESWLYSSPQSRLNDVFDRPYQNKFLHIDVSLMRVLSALVTHHVGVQGPVSKAIYLHRPEGSARAPVNQDELIAKLVQIGFEVVCPEKLSFVEQVQVFQSASSVLAPSGAALANILWMRPGTEVTVLGLNHPYKDYSLWFSLAESVGAKLRVLRQEPVSPILDFSERTWHSDFVVDVEEVISATRF